MKWLFLCMVVWLNASAQRPPLRIMQWNVENLFDCNDDSLHDDSEFLSQSPKQWTRERYWRKQEALGRVIMGVGGNRPVSLVGLCEVENDSVMYDLTQRSVLRSMRYAYIMTNSSDVRGIDVALMYQPLRFRILAWHSVRIPSLEHGFKPTRDLLWACGITDTKDTLHVIVCHLPSRRAGNIANHHRLLAAQTLANLTDSIGRGKNIIVMGDFNAPPHDPIFRVLNTLHDAVPQQRHPHEGTYRYRGMWSWIDHILLSSSLLKRTTPVHLYSAPWMQEKDSNGGWHPRRTYLGTHYHAGVSDHVPIWLDFQE